MTMNNLNIYNFDPDYIGSKIASSDWGACWDYLAVCLENLSPYASSISMGLNIELQNKMKQEDGKEYARQFGSLLGELFVHLLTEPKSILSDKNFNRLIIYHETLHTLFQINGINNLDSLVDDIFIKNKKKEMPFGDQKKMLLLLSLDGELDIVAILKRVSSQYRIEALVAYFGYQKIFRKNIYNNKIKLYALRHELEKTFMNEDVFTRNIVGYFQSSYLNMPDKHSIKESINAACRNYLFKIAKSLKKLKEGAAEYHFARENAKPTLLIIAEVFAHGSAMYRGWGRMMIDLQREFNVVFTIPSDKGDDALAADFKNYVTFESFSKLYQIIHAVKPDVIFMPSIGMRFYNILISNMRAAPIQIMGLGHPATTMSEYIDYVVSPSGLYDPAAFPKDFYIDDGYPEKHMPLLSKEEFFKPLDSPPSHQDDVLRVGVVGADIKMSYPFFQLLKDIVETSPFKIHLTFIIATAGVDTLYLEKLINDNFTSTTIYGWQKYNDYINTIKGIDIVLNQFPFGHTNTVIDTIMCGKPCVGMNGVEPASKTEGDVLEKVGLKDAFVAENEQEYKEKFFALGRRILNGEKEFFDRNKVYDRIFADLGDYDYSQIVRWIYDNHVALKASGKNYAKALSDF